MTDTQAVGRVPRVREALVIAVDTSRQLCRDAEETRRQARQARSASAALRAESRVVLEPLRSSRVEQCGSCGAGDSAVPRPR